MEASDKDNLQFMKTSNSAISQIPLTGSYSNFKSILRGPNQNLNRLQIKKTSDGKSPQNTKSGISQ